MVVIATGCRSSALDTYWWHHRKTGDDNIIDDAVTWRAVSASARRALADERQRSSLRAFELLRPVSHCRFKMNISSKDAYQLRHMFNCNVHMYQNIDNSTQYRIVPHHDGRSAFSIAAPKRVFRRHRHE